MHGNVLPPTTAELALLDRPRQKPFREAVAKVIRDVKAKNGLSNVELAEEIGCCADTVSNAENQNNDLTAVILLNIAWRFGEAAILPVRLLYLRYQAPRTVFERLDDALADLDTIRRELGEGARGA